MIRVVFGRMDTRASLPGLLEIAETWRPELIVSEGYEYAGALAGELHGIPSVRVGTGLASMEDWALELAAAPVESLRSELGRPADPGGERPRGLPYLTRTPLSFEDPALPALPATYRFRDPSPAAAEPLPDWWAGSGDPLVYVSFGSVAGGLPFFPAFYRAAIDALAGLPVRVLVTVGRGSDPAELGTVPANVRVERWVPQEQVAREAAVIVGHGGYGSTLGALVQGVPMVVVPLFADQPHNAARVAELGAGIALPQFPTMRAAFEDGPRALGPLAGAVSAVLADPSYRLAAAGVAAEARSLPPVSAAVALLERLAAGGAEEQSGRLTRRPLPHQRWCSGVDPYSLRGFSGSASGWTSAGSSSSS